MRHATQLYCMAAEAAERRKTIAHGASRGLGMLTGSPGRGVRNVPRIPAFLRPCRGWLRTSLCSHGLRHGLMSAAAPRLDSTQAISHTCFHRLALPQQPHRRLVDHCRRDARHAAVIQWTDFLLTWPAENLYRN